ncbi:16507_t:CDS:2, partial [Entrophospora sp. SA101]
FSENTRKTEIPGVISNSNSNRTCLLYEKFHSNYYECMKRSYAKIDIERSNALKLSAYKNKKMLEASAISHKIIQ